MTAEDRRIAAAVLEWLRRRPATWPALRGELRARGGWSGRRIQRVISWLMCEGQVSRQERTYYLTGGPCPRP